MKQKMLQLFGIAIMLISTMAIAQTNGALYSLNGSAETISKMDMKTKEITQDLVAVGSVPNRIYTHEGMLYVVNSTPENIMVIDPNNDTEVKTTIAIEEGSNPWAMAFVSNERAYVTGFAADLVYVVDLTSGTVTSTIPVGVGPEGIIVKDGKAYIANTGYVSWDSPYEQATISIIDVETDEVVASVDVPTNAQDLTFAPDGSLHVVCTGDYATAFGAVAVIDVTLDTPATIDTVTIGGSPGDIEISSEGYGYLSAWGNETNGFLYKYDANTYEAINDETNPILVGPNFSGITNVTSANSLWLPTMTEWGGDGFAQLFDPSSDEITWTSDVIGNGASDFTYVEEKYFDQEPIELTGILYSLNGSAETISKMDLATKEITQDLVAVGSVPNRIYSYEGMLYVVNSTPENIMVIDPNNDTEIKTTIAIEEGSNPWAMAFVSNERAYVTGFAADLVYVVDLTSGTVTSTIPVGVGPEGIIVKDGKAYVANTGYVSWDSPYEQATVTIIDIETDEVVASVDVPTNAQDLAFAPNGSLHVVCTGDYATAFGAVAVIDVTSDTPAAIDTVTIGGSPGDIEISAEGYGYLSAWGNETNGFLYKYDANTYEAINNESNPILVGSNFSGLTYMNEENVLWLPYMTEWGGDGFAQLFDPTVDVINWTSEVIGNGASDFAYLSDEYTSVEEVTSAVANEYNLSQNYPNPFNPTTTIQFSVPKQAVVSMKVFNVLGQQVSELVNKEMTAGSYKVSFDASKLTSGVYFYTIQAGDFKATKKMMLLK